MYRHIRARYTIRLKLLAPLFHQVRSKTILIGLHMFSPASNQLNVFTSSFDWFTGLLMSFVTGWSYCFGFGFMTIN